MHFITFLPVRLKFRGLGVKSPSPPPGTALLVVYFFAVEIILCFQHHFNSMVCLYLQLHKFQTQATVCIGAFKTTQQQSQI